MWSIAAVVTSSVLFGVSLASVSSITLSAVRPIIFYTARKLDLDSNPTSYGVGCTFNSDDVEKSAHAEVMKELILHFGSNYKRGEKMLNETAFIHEVDVQPYVKENRCHVERYMCLLSDHISKSVTIYLSKRPPPIESSEFICVILDSYEVSATCRFQRKNFCELYTTYELSVLERHNFTTSCKPFDNGTDLSFNCESRDFFWEPEHTFILKSENYMGTRTNEYKIERLNFLKPKKLELVEVAFINSTNARIQWYLSLRNKFSHMFEYEILLISKYKTESIKTQTFHLQSYFFGHQFGELYAFTDYELQVRVRFVPKISHKYEEDYWSDWTTFHFMTRACEPGLAAITTPGAYSLKERQGNRATIEVFWHEIPEYLRNGPNFQYKLFAISSDGRRFHTTIQNNETGTFQNMRTDENYRVEIYSENDMGRSPDTAVIYIFPQKEDYEPILKKILYDKGKSYELHWFPAHDLDNLSNYTVMYCKSSVTGSCLGSVKFEVLPPSTTNYSIRSEIRLSFALAANYPNYSTELSWQQCIVSSESTLSQPKFTLTDRMQYSAVLRLDVPCTYRYLVERYNVAYWPKDEKVAQRNMSYDSFISIVKLDGLLPDTEYEVVVQAIDGQGVVYEKKETFRTASKDIFLLIGLILIIGIGLTITVGTVITRRVRTMLDIKVELPEGLMEIYEKPNTIIFSDESMSKTIVDPDKLERNGTLYTIDEEPETTVNDTNIEQTDSRQFLGSSKLKALGKRKHRKDKNENSTIKSNGYVLQTQMKVGPLSKEGPNQALSEAVSKLSTNKLVDTVL